MRLTTLAFILTVLSMSGFSALTPVWAADEEPKLPGPLQSLVNDGAQIRYLGHDLNMNGWVVIKNGQEQYFYATPDGQAILSGVLFNNKGDVVTLRQINDIRKKEGPAIDKLAGFNSKAAVNKETSQPSGAITPPSATSAGVTNPADMMKTATKSKAEQLFAGVESANWVPIGSEKAPPIYMFIDPECPHCHDVLKDIRQSGYLEKGMVQLRLIPVGVLSANSLKEAAYLLASPSPKDDLFRHLDGDKNALLVDSKANTQGAERNMKLMQDWNLDVTPFSVYKDKDGKIKVLQGRPKDLKEIITELR